MHVSTLLADALDPVLTASVFAAGQTGLSPGGVSGDPRRSDDRWRSQSGSVIWCAAYRDFQQALPALPQSYGNDIGVDYECVDLTITVTRGTEHH